MATSAPPPPQTTTTPQPAAPHVPTPAWVHFSSLAVCVLGPIALFTPPRKVGLQALGIATGVSVGINILAYDYTGESFYQRGVRRYRTLGTAAAESDALGGLPTEQARRTQELLRQHREAGMAEAEKLRAREERDAKERGVLGRFWMGGEKEGWKEERARKDKEALEAGKGYGDLIVEQVKEVFSSKKEEGEEKKDEKNGENKKP